MRGGWWGEDWEGQDSGQGGCKYLKQYALMYWNIYKCNILYIIGER